MQSAKLTLFTKKKEYSKKIAKRITISLTILQLRNEKELNMCGIKAKSRQNRFFNRFSGYYSTYPIIRHELLFCVLTLGRLHTTR
jgi:hypothetical protein